MVISGEEAKDYIVISLSSFEQVNRGELVAANDTTGEVQYKDITGEIKSMTLGDHTIRIIPKYPR